MNGGSCYLSVVSAPKPTWFNKILQCCFVLHKSLSSLPENLKVSIVCTEEHEKRPDKRNWQSEERSKKTQIHVKSMQLM